MISHYKTQLCIAFTFAVVSIHPYIGFAQSTEINTRTTEYDVRGQGSTPPEKARAFSSDLTTINSLEKDLAEKKRSAQSQIDALRSRREKVEAMGTMSGTKWSAARGWHVFRHSFCSNCAAAGIDQRLINAWVGHQTEEIVKRYRHLIPDQQQRAIAEVFPG